jgi:hypothetical protein
MEGEGENSSDLMMEGVSSTETPANIYQLVSVYIVYFLVSIYPEANDVGEKHGLVPAIVAADTGKEPRTVLSHHLPTRTGLKPLTAIN